MVGLQNSASAFVLPRSDYRVASTFVGRIPHEDGTTSMYSNPIALSRHIGRDPTPVQRLGARSGARWRPAVRSRSVTPGPVPEPVAVAPNPAGRSRSPLT